MASKTEAPTPRRLRRAQEQGDVAVSPAAARVASLLVGVVMLPGLLTLLALRSLDLFRRAVNDPGQWHSILGSARQDLLLILVPWLLAMVLAGVAITWLQTRRLATWQRVAPKPERLTASGLAAYWFSGQAWASIALAVVGCAVFLALAVVMARHDLQSFAHAAERPLLGVPLTLRVIERTAWAAVAVVVLIAGGDWWLRVVAWRERLRMTRAEWLEDQREAFGDPQIRTERARRQRAD